jgi:hypothetical protein
MQYELTQLDLEETPLPFDSRLRALILYEDVLAGKHAKEMCDALAENLGAEWQIEIELSSFKSLHLEPVWRKTASALSNAHLVVFSCHDGDLPFAVWSWAELCLNRSTQSTALVALLSGAPCQTKSPRAVEKYLLALARRRGLPFFSHRQTRPKDRAIERFVPLMQKEMSR